MNKEQSEIISNDTLKTSKLLDDEEIKIANKILNNLQGTLIIRANSILEFCLKAIQHSKFNG